MLTSSRTVSEYRCCESQEHCLLEQVIIFVGKRFIVYKERNVKELKRENKIDCYFFRGTFWKSCVKRQFMQILDIYNIHSLTHSQPYHRSGQTFRVWILEFSKITLWVMSTRYKEGVFLNSHWVARVGLQVYYILLHSFCSKTRVRNFILLKWCLWKLIELLTDRTFPRVARLDLRSIMSLSARK